MICNSCGSSFSDDQQICPNCGAQAPQIEEQQAEQPVSQSHQSPVIKQQVVTNVAPAKRKNVMATIGLILGIISLIECWRPYVGFGIATLGLVFSIIGVAGKNAGGKGKAIAGIILAVISIFTGLTVANWVLSSNKSTQATASAVVSTVEATTSERP